MALSCIEQPFLSDILFEVASQAAKHRMHSLMSQVVMKAQRQGHKSNIVA